MFTQKKKNYQTFLYVAVVVTLCFLVLALLWPQDASEEPSADLSSTSLRSEDQDKPQEPDSSEAPDVQASDEDPEESSDGEPDEELQNPSDGADQKDNMSGSADSYYLVKHADGQIKVYFVNGDGSMIELEHTSIVYEVLGIEDQKHFDAGWRISSQEELAVLLQDFES